MLRGPYPLDGRTYDAVSLISNGAGSYQSWTWDLATGVLLVSSSRQDGAFSPFAAPGETPPQANSFLGYRQLVSIRQRTTPGIGTAPPAWVLGTGRLSYAGTWTFVNPMDPGSGAMVMPMTSEATFTEGGPTWANVRFRNVIDFSGVPNASEGTNLATGVGAWWWDPAALAAMERGQVLDEMPLLSARIDGGGCRAVAGRQLRDHPHRAARQRVPRPVRRRDRRAPGQRAHAVLAGCRRLTRSARLCSQSKNSGRAKPLETFPNL